MLFYLSNPSSAGANGGTTAAPINTNANVFGGILAAQFKF
jgi:hypothetical protein